MVEQRDTPEGVLLHPVSRRADTEMHSFADWWYTLGVPRSVLAEARKIVRAVDAANAMDAKSAPGVAPTSYEKDLHRVRLPEGVGDLIVAFKHGPLFFNEEVMVPERAVELSKDLRPFFDDKHLDPKINSGSKEVLVAKWKVMDNKNGKVLVAKEFEFYDAEQAQKGAKTGVVKKKVELVIDEESLAKLNENPPAEKK